MRLLFITSAYEPGRDGVGDYVRLLGEKCQLAGHECAVLALNDKFTSQKIEIESHGFKLLRLPVSISRKQKEILSKTFIDFFRPDWVSLQFVSYGYDKNGIASDLYFVLKKVLPNTTIPQVTFHELWIGTEKGHQIKPFIIGQAQKFFIMRILKKFKPKFVCATTEVFCFMLSQNGIKSHFLPTFSNIQKTGDTSKFDYQSFVSKTLPREEALFFVFFGSINPNWNHRLLFEYLLAQQHKTGKKFVIFSVGVLGKGEGIWEEISNTYSNNLTFVKLGPKSDEEISVLFNECDFGLTGYPEIVYEKSGAIAAMIDNGLKVILSNDTVQQPGFHRKLNDPSILKLDDIKSNIILNYMAKVEVGDLLKKVSEEFLTQFEK
jgi:hypothetical protein